MLAHVWVKQMRENWVGFVIVAFFSFAISATVSFGLELGPMVVVVSVAGLLSAFALLALFDARNEIALAAEYGYSPLD